jgi:Zn-dependent protease with chaperone function
MTAAGAITYCGQCQEVLLADQPFCTRCGAATAVGVAAMPHSGDWNCVTCGGNGAKLGPRQHVCPACRWLRPLAPDYHMPIEVFQWSFDRQAMDTLRSIGPLTAAANALSGRISRPWLEASVNGVRLGPDQLPEIFFAAVHAARVLALPRMPEVYVSGEQMWDCMTLGGDNEAFVVVGSVLTALKGPDLAFLLGRQMGHVAAGHALWKSVMQFVSGRSQNRTIMGNGILQFLNPAKIVESAIDAPLMAWARHAEITADRAGALAVGNKTVVRRVLGQWSLKSFPLYNRLNLAALERDIAVSDDRQIALSEWTMSSTPYLARRLRLIDEYFETETLTGWRAIIEHWTRPPPPPKPAHDPNVIRLNCVACGNPMRLQKKDMAGKEKAKVKCPNDKCGKLMEIAPRPPDKAEVKRILKAPPAGMKISCPACSATMVVPAGATAGKTEVNVRCPAEACRKVLTVKLPDALTPAAPDLAKPAAEPPQRMHKQPRPEETAE